MSCYDKLVVGYKLAHKWGFDATGSSWLKELEAADPMTKIAMYDDYALDPEGWFVPEIEKLVLQQSTLSLMEGEKLGMERVLKVHQLREQWSVHKGYTDMGYGLGASDRIKQTIRNAWSLSQPKPIY